VELRGTRAVRRRGGGRKGGGRSASQPQNKLEIAEESNKTCAGEGVRPNIHRVVLYDCRANKATRAESLLWLLPAKSAAARSFT